ncbi:MAG TPA: carboxypeptidase-like regulatory domain-containing protein [Planctomycetota bacterium]|nr:carboxypeptidase-like regulatory domain-containing protein [Planctomycetota bacterium]
MTVARGAVLGLLGASVAAAAATAVLPVAAEPVVVSPPVRFAVPRDELVVACEAEVPGRELAPSVAGTVVDERGVPVAGMAVAMAGSDDTVVSAADGSFVFRTVEPGRCRVLPAAGWLALESPLLDLCGTAHAPTLVVVRAARCEGRVIDEQGLPLAEARVAVELRVDLCAGGPARSARFTGAWSTTSDGDGWYKLPFAPSGANAMLVVAHDGFVATRAECSDAPVYRHVTLARAAPPDTDAAEGPADAAGHRLEGWLCDAQQRPRAGWWAAPVAEHADVGNGGRWGRFAGLPVRVAPDGHFACGDLPAGSYRIEAWQPDNAAVARSPVVTVPAPGERLCAPDAVLPARLCGRVVGGDGRPVAGARLGLGRPTGWAAPTPLAMHAASIVTTDRDGRFELATHGLAALELCVDGVSIVPLRTVLAVEDAARPVMIRAAARRWLGDGDAIAVAGASLVALDAAGRALPMWHGGAPAPRDACDAAVGGPFGFPADARRLVCRVGSREVAQLDLRQ